MKKEQFEKCLPMLLQGDCLELMKDIPDNLIKTYTNEGETVLDNCMGSGTTGIACLNTNREFVGIEKSAKYFEIAQRRINNDNPKL